MLNVEHQVSLMQVLTYVQAFLKSPMSNLMLLHQVLIMMYICMDLDSHV